MSMGAAELFILRANSDGSICETMLKNSAAALRVKSVGRQCESPGEINALQAADLFTTPGSNSWTYE